MCSLSASGSEPVIRTASKRPGLASPETSEVAGSRKCLQIQALLKAHWAGRDHVGSVPGAGQEADTERGSCYTSSLSPGPVRVPLVRIWDQAAERNSPRSPLHEVPISQMATRNLARRSWSPSLASQQAQVQNPQGGCWGCGGRRERDPAQGPRGFQPWRFVLQLPLARDLDAAEEEWKPRGRQLRTAPQAAVGTDVRRSAGLCPRPPCDLRSDLAMQGARLRLPVALHTASASMLPRLPPSQPLPPYTPTPKATTRLPPAPQGQSRPCHLPGGFLLHTP